MTIGRIMDWCLHFFWTCPLVVLLNINQDHEMWKESRTDLWNACFRGKLLLNSIGNDEYLMKLILTGQIMALFFFFNLTKGSWGQFWPQRSKTPNGIKASAGVRNDPKTHVGVKIDPRNPFTWLFLGTLSKVKDE